MSDGGVVAGVDGPVLRPQFRRLLGEVLDPDDPRLLPDGSRWVDARALLLVARAVISGR